MNIMRAICFLSMLVFLSGCYSYEMTSGRNLESYGAAFTQELYDRYVALSEGREAAGDWKDAEHFNLKARQAGYGGTVLPDEAMDRDLSEGQAATFSRARYNLLVFFDERLARSQYPARAAEAQVSYDCWIEAVEANRADDATACRYAMDEAMDIPQPVAAAETPVVYIVYFEFDSASLTSSALSNIQSAVRAAAEAGITEFSITGHTDRAGSEEYNQRLSLRRANAVADALVARGVSQDAISIAGRGEADNAVPTEDGVREQQNRRVEIVLQ